MTDNAEPVPTFDDALTDIVVKVAIGAVLAVFALLVIIALLSFIQDRGGTLDNLPAPEIKAAVDAAVKSE